MSPDELKKVLEPFFIEHRPVYQAPFFSVREEGLLELSCRSGRPLARLMIDCLALGWWPERFRPQRLTFSAKEQISLLESTVAVIGAGGLGGILCLLLARVGVGNLIICDGDNFDESNLNRQFLAKPARLGDNKALCAVEEIRNINSAVNVRPFPIWATEANLPEILGPAQVVVDCLDNLKIRYLVEQAARRLGLPFVHGAVGGLEGFVMTVFPEDAGLIGLYGPDPAGRELAAESFVGVPTISPALVASLQANEVVHILMDRTPPARGRLLHVDLSAGRMEALKLG